MAYPTPLATLRSRASRLGSRFGPAAAVLLYHRIVPKRGDDPLNLEVSAEEFEEHLRVLAFGYRVVPLRQLAEELRRGVIVDRNTIAISFDDGYLDNLNVAAPILQRFDTPATFFIATRYVEEDAGEFFWMRAASAPGAETVQEQLKTQRPAEQDLSGLPETSSDPLARPMRRAELRALAQDPRFDLGAHTHSHTQLAALTAAEISDELRSSRKVIESLTQQPCPLLAYPFGGPADMGPYARRAAKRVGFRAAFTAERYLIRWRTDPWFIPRFTVPSCDGVQFAEWLSRLGVAPQARYAGATFA